MTHQQFNTPILFIVFNRPEATKRVFEAIKKIRPQKLFVAGDGPRPHKDSDKETCNQVRKIATAIDWPCEVKTLFQDKNLGSGLGPATAINWFFEQVEAGIILEDDCLPHQSFFYFCQELLDRYRDNPKIMHISGNNFQSGRRRGSASYYFSKYSHNWGWATWRRAWRLFDFYAVPAKNRENNWDQQWFLALKKHGGLAILPNVNLVSNIGFGEGASNTHEQSPYANLPTQQIQFPLAHPSTTNRNRQADLYTAHVYFNQKYTSIIRMKIATYIKKVLPAFLKNFIKTCGHKAKQFLKNRRYNALYQKYQKFTMIPKPAFQANLNIVDRFRSVEGSIVECGVWRGGMIAAMANILGPTRHYYLFDSFEGLPPAKDIDGESAIAWQKNTSSPYYFDNCSAEESYAREALTLSAVPHYHIIKGWYQNTLPSWKPIGPIAILRLDSDWYESTMECLTTIYPYLAKGGIIMIDDYYTWDGCARAIHDFLSKNKLADRIYSDNGVSYIIKT